MNKRQARFAVQMTGRRIGLELGLPRPDAEQVAVEAFDRGRLYKSVGSCGGWGPATWPRVAEAVRRVLTEWSDKNKKKEKSDHLERVQDGPEWDLNLFYPATPYGGWIRSLRSLKEERAADSTTPWWWDGPAGLWDPEAPARR